MRTRSRSRSRWADCITRRKQRIHAHYAISALTKIINSGKKHCDEPNCSELFELAPPNTVTSMEATVQSLGNKIQSIHSNLHTTWCSLLVQPCPERSVASYISFTAVVMHTQRLADAKWWVQLAVQGSEIAPPYEVSFLLKCNTYEAHYAYYKHSTQ